MERAAALKKLVKLLGKKAAWRIDHKAATKDQRAEAKAQIRPVREERDKLREAVDARAAALLAADTEYQNLLAARREASKKVDHLSGILRDYKITVGTNEGLFFRVEAEGDSWEEIFAKIEKKKEPA